MPYRVCSSLYGKLYDTNAGLGLVPQLAASLPQVSPDGLNYTISLRPGVRFNDAQAQGYLNQTIWPTIFPGVAIFPTVPTSRTCPGAGCGSSGPRCTWSSRIRSLR